MPYFRRPVTYIKLVLRDILGQEIPNLCYLYNTVLYVMDYICIDDLESREDKTFSDSMYIVYASLLGP